MTAYKERTENILDFGTKIKMEMFLILCMDYINDSNIFTSTMFIAFYYLFYNNVMYQQT